MRLRTRFSALAAIALGAVLAGSNAPARAETCNADAGPLSGQAPLAVTFTSNCSTSHWDFGDGRSADATTVGHTFGAGAYTVTLSSGGSVVKTFAIVAQTLRLNQPAKSNYGKASVISGKLEPAASGIAVNLLRKGDVVAKSATRSDGSFAFRLDLASPGPFLARAGTVVSNSVLVSIRPRLKISVRGKHLVGQSLLLYSNLRPIGAGKLRLVAVRGGHRVMTRIFDAGKAIALPTSSYGAYKASIEVVPAGGFRSVESEIDYSVGAPPLHLGSRGPSVLALENELIAHHFALLRADSIFGADTLESVYAVQKLAGLPRTGSVDAATWAALARSQPPQPRLSGSYVEVDKTKQVLFIVRNSRVILIVPCSTGATGNTPIGLFHVYSKVPGGAVMYYSNYFTGAFAIHGYVDVPPYPASHGCVRVPMWVAIRLYGMISMDMRVLIHY